MKKTFTACLLLSILFCSCRRYAIYQSPLHLNTSSYKATPLKSESIPAATYASVSFMAGGANHKWHDDTYSFTGSLHRSHNFGSFQAYYGGNVVLGNYRVRSYLPIDTPGIFNSRAFNDSAINAMAGGKSFGAWGAVGGINVVVPVGQSEWRALGTELSWNNEFGQYLSFRKDLPKGIANIVSRKRSYFTIGFFTEFVGRFDNGNSAGYKVAWVTNAQKLRDDDRIYSSMRDFTPVYLSQTVHLTLSNITLHAQWNIGSYASNLQTGINVRMGKTKKAGKSASL